MDAVECERAVAGCLPGDFLVRQSASGGRCVLVVNDHHNAVNYPVPLGGGGSGYTFAGSTFASLDLVIRPGTSSCRLTKLKIVSQKWTAC